jgi:[glutamine synthetase] adenylyltransferase / [glutamine synthetase]-adenylyl-L-tyrosine phosphorylase
MRVPAMSGTTEAQLRALPEPHTAERLFEHFSRHPASKSLLDRNPGLLADVLTLAAWSPLLATTLENNPDYLPWLQRERANTRVRTLEELGESLARFLLVNSQVDPHVMLARFRRRELLRTYLHDIRRVRTVVETTEELSNLADTVLQYALKRSRQELDNRYGAPQTVDEHGRISSAEFCVVALGKLGSCELNYASDIDLVFLFSHDGMTAAGGSAGQISNREYFVKLSERLLKLVSEPTGEGASYRIDVRLRPHGREGALASSLTEAVKYYERIARDWELQTLIRSRAAAGSHRLYTTFAKRVVDRIFRKDISVASALANVRMSKEEIDLQRERAATGLNVKLGRGGIREIEFIAQALQVAFGGGDPWLRAPHTLISLGRLAERNLINESEHQQLSDAYHFLRALEHRLQMEHGLQTHSVPVEPSRREVVARRMSFTGSDALAEFETALRTHTENVRAAFDRVFGAEAALDETQIPTPRSAAIAVASAEADEASLQFASRTFARHSHANQNYDAATEEISDLLRTELNTSPNAHRALSLITRVAASLDKENSPVEISDRGIRRLVRLCGVSEFFGEMLSGRPTLLPALDSGLIKDKTKAPELAQSWETEKTFSGELDVLRREWSRQFVAIGAADAENELEPSELNRGLTQLAIASIDNALAITLRELHRRFEKLSREPQLAVLGLGRLGSGGVDYGSDLDMVLVYDSDLPPPIDGLTNEETYARLAEFLITALSSITREGFLYRVDLRLRPDGQKGALAAGSQSFLNYVRKRAGIWEWLAYVKLRAVAGDLEFGRRLETEARQAIHELARESDAQQLRNEALRVRDLLEREKGSARRGGINIKHGAGGMLDVYFATRYLQLRDNVPDDESDRTTMRTIERLRAAGSLDERDAEALSSGYELLRAVDHQLRLIVGRSATLPALEQPAFLDIARRLGYSSEAELSTTLRERMRTIRKAYERIMQG